MKDVGFYYLFLKSSERKNIWRRIRYVFKEMKSPIWLGHRTKDDMSLMRKSSEIEGPGCQLSHLAAAAFYSHKYLSKGNGLLCLLGMDVFPPCRLSLGWNGECERAGSLALMGTCAVRSGNPWPLSCRFHPHLSSLFFFLFMILPSSSTCFYSLPSFSPWQIISYSFFPLYLG